MHRQRCTRIIATLGPASSTEEVIRKLSDAGADVFRLNMSHGTYKDISQIHSAIRQVENTTGRAIGILADLQGPKLRVGVFASDKVELVQDQEFILDMDEKPGTQKRVQLPHPEIYQAVEKGTDLLLDDGKIRLTIKKVEENRIITTVTVGGMISNRKGVNVPNAILPMAALTVKDKKDLDFVLSLGVDWVGLSFVQRPEDVQEAKNIIGTQAKVLAKLEKPAALYALDEIIDLSDAVMVARGDMGVELPMEEVPAKQKKIIRHARRAGKPVVVATQMMESMILSPVPTRAEVSDVANAVFDGTDAIMLSAETAAGQYPVEAVSYMDRIAQTVEREPSYRKTQGDVEALRDPTSADALSAAAKQIAGTLETAVIVTYTTSGSTAIRAARERPTTPLLVLTPNQSTARRLTIVWGLNCVHTEDATNFQDMIDKACHISAKYNFAKLNDRVVITAGMPFGSPGKTNVIRVARIQSYHVE
ncbi:MAG: pyruvate kinase [Emcibacter sp.]|nr:pyruvate kinase [Emcibacter sp.]